MQWVFSQMCVCMRVNCGLNNAELKFKRRQNKRGYILKLNNTNKAMLRGDMGVRLISFCLVFYSQRGQAQEQDGSFSQKHPEPQLTLQTCMDTDECTLGYIKSLRS